MSRTILNGGLVFQDWFSTVMRHPRSSHRDYEHGPPRLFRNTMITIFACDGSPQIGGTPHYMAPTHVRERFRWDLGEHFLGEFGGDVSAAFQHACNIHQARKERAQCFRSDHKNFKLLCTGDCSTATIFIQLPTILIIELNADISRNPTAIAAELSNFPEKLFPFGDDDTLQYEIQSRIFHSPLAGHYIARYRAGETNYICSERSSTVATHLAGTTRTINDVPHGFYTTSATYRLIGDLQSQTRFYNRQCRDLAGSSYYLDVLGRLTNKSPLEFRAKYGHYPPSY
ncbi:hypothetical protein BDV98DRAFT_583179 [Pterulicium gracile]|uniref:Uncharacterized protein n=1 Tax=Pterulicium gracile TaxID=1884261 RepID=A0A5C3QHG7_9AGAR|nr:hypothetical protein BDV98DRAFT_583179 [Pterula gracilis]